ncbi:uncharacterized protein LOC111115092 isoform X1 [Crassostrea virginica]|uniref:Uncharacterized protein LOC111115092 isoform X1 n=1 Tax=Crassostrea virginica TaxID=6565 RepID=A0A8B8C148_CRAVI|nr:uncharacterized protein LOC111115092 isoform X1 [Crassostrea virginica]
MKILILCLLPVAFAASVPQKRVLIDTLLNGQEAKTIIDQLVTFLSSDDNEAKCEQECHTLIRDQQSVVQHLCPFLCHSAQQALANLHHTKRLVFDTFLNGNETKAIINQLVTFLSSDDNEAKCEQECHTLIRDQQSVVQHLCPFLCHSAQSALAGLPHKRLVFDTFLNGNETKSIINQLVTFLSSDDNEAKCEQECHTLIRDQQSVVQHLCPFLCHSAQQALFGLPHKRFLMVFDNPAFLNGHETKAIIDQLVTFLSSDDNEAKCEQECHTLIRNQQSVVQHLCPFLCHSAQQALAALPHKRLILGNFLNTNETSHIIDQLVATFGSHETEVQCERECHILIKNSESVFQHMCPFLCHSAEAIINNVGHHTTLPAGNPVRRVLADGVQ